MYDTERGVLRQLVSNTASGQGGASGNDLDGFNSNGFSLGTDNYAIVNKSGGDYVSWTFRKQKGFFDVVTYTGNDDGSRTIAHNLGSVPGMIIIKCSSTTDDWIVYHRSLGFSQKLYLNGTADASSMGSRISAADASTFTPGSDNSTNATGRTYVAYIFAHDDAQFGTDEDESIIKCGTYNGSSGTQTINLGFEPQWLLIKRSDSGDNWRILDVMREMSTSDARYLNADTTVAEGNHGSAWVSASSTGFTLYGSDGSTNRSGGTYIYMAIRRPNKPPEVGTEVFDIQQATSEPWISSSTVRADMVIATVLRSLLSKNIISSRLTGSRGLYTNQNVQEQSRASQFEYDQNTGVYQNNMFGGDMINYTFSRAPGFMDVVTYTGNGALRNITHGLDATPGMIWIKRRDGGNGNWTIWSGELSSNTILQFTGNPTNPEMNTGGNGYINSSTSTTFNIGTDSDVNANTSTYIAYLFATLPGISKVGSYTGTGNAINVDCGFTNGARFVLIKRKTGGNGDWYVWDSVRSIVSGNDPYLFLNSSAAQVTYTDYVDPLTSGFTVTASAPAALNTSGSTYLFFAIA